MLEGLYKVLLKIGTGMKFVFNNERNQCSETKNKIKTGSKKFSAENNNINQQGETNIVNSTHYNSPSHEAAGVSPTASEVPEVTNSRPKLRHEMFGGHIFIPDNSPDLTGIAIDARVWNTGTPSVVTSWGLVVVPKGTSPIIAQLTKIPEIMKVSGVQNSAIIRASDALDSKVKSTPVGDIPIEGKLLFYVKLPQHIVLDDNTSLELTAKDIYEVETCKIQRMGDWLKR